ncbi:hypothetical protein [Chryseobacterium sp. CT-SW4]|uniref:hypothetical protein n=1 Tax=Chryseobacterium sp. SW-1 TaxID=3157343 RepID=UPI003B02AEE9
MGTSYISEDKVYAVCTYQLGTSPQKFSHSRDTLSVFYQNKNQPILTEKDKNIKEEFTCKSPVNLAATLLAFGAGIIVGALLLSNPLGWIALAAGGVLLAAGTVAVVAAATHSCTDPLKGGHWLLVHGSVKINKSKAITRSSILKCGSNGILTPFFSKAAAKQAAEDIAFNNQWELGINTITSFGAGAFLPGAFGGIAGATTMGGRLIAGSQLGGRFLLGFGLFSGISYGERELIRDFHGNGTLEGNTTYDRMNSYQENYIDPKTNQMVEVNIDQNTLFGTPSKPDDLFQDSTDLINVTKNGSTGSYDITYLSKITGIAESISIFTNNQELCRQLDNLDGLSRPALRTNPLANQLLADLNAGKYPEWKNGIRFYNSERMTPSMVDDGRVAQAQVAKNNLQTVTSNSIQGLLFVLPFIGTIFSENARADLAIAMARDFSEEPDGISIIANTPID